MNLFSGNCVKFCRCMVKHLCTTSTTVSVAFLTTAGLVVLVILSNSACSPSVTETPPERTRPIPTPTDIPISTAPSAPTPTLLPPVALSEPDDGARLVCRSDVTMHWRWPYALQEGDSYRLRVKGPDSALVYHERDYYTLNALAPGQYNWAVSVVRSNGPGPYVAVSEESETYGFEIAPPAPVVHSISPTSTVQGVSVPIVISGEKFTRSLVITIGVSLQATFVDSSTLTATVPITLETGEYPVLVGSSTGESVPTVSFVVKRQPPKPTPRPVYPAPQLLGVDVFGCSVTFQWDWDRALAPDEWFAVRLGRGDQIPHSVAWTKERTHPYYIGDEAGEYSWQITICRGDPGAGACPDPLAISERGFFTYPGCAKDF